MCKKCRKLCAIFLIITMFASLTACGRSTTKNQKDVNSSSTSDQQLSQSTDEVEPSVEIGEPKQEPEVIQETIEDKAKKAMKTLEVWDGRIAESFDAGDGSFENPYQIANAAQLAKLAADTNSGVDFSSKYFLLTNDILLNNISAWDFGITPEENVLKDIFVNQWIPIGLNYRFNGSFNGGEHIIYGLYNTKFYSRSGNATGNIGLFGEFDGEISNITIACGWFASGAENIGTIAGRIYDGYIQNCHVLHVGIKPEVSKNVGGICGDFVYNDKIMVSNCSASGTISCLGYATKEFNEFSVGGIVGRSIGYDYNGTISNCCNSFDIIVYADVMGNYYGYNLLGINVGGICGIGEIVEGCFNTGNIAIEAYNKPSDEAEDIPFIRVGGIAGTCHVSATNCCSNGKIVYKEDISVADSGAGAYIGGVFGLVGNTRTSISGMEVVNVIFCYSNTKINTSSSEAYVGGISGSACGEITVTDCYYDAQEEEKGIGVILDYGSSSSKIFTNRTKGVSEVELKNVSTFSGWDFDYIWMLDERINDGFPIPTLVLEFLNYSNSSK